MPVVAISVWMEPVTSVAIVQPGISLWGSISISLGSWLGLGLPLAVVAEVVTVVTSITQMMAIAIIAQTSIAQPMSIVPIAIRMSSVAETVIVQPGVSLWVSLSVSLSSGFGLSLLYGLDSLLLSSGGGNGRDQAVGENSVGAGGGGTLVVLAADRGSVDQGMVDGVGVAIGQGKVTRGVDKPGLGLSLSSSIGGDS